MPSKHTEPILNIAIDNLEKIGTGEAEMYSIWRLFTKCKDNLENGDRLQNLSWRF
jgi:hypothetical protein